MHDDAFLYACCMFRCPIPSSLYSMGAEVSGEKTGKRLPSAAATGRDYCCRGFRLTCRLRRGASAGVAGSATSIRRKRSRGSSPYCGHLTCSAAVSAVQRSLCCRMPLPVQDATVSSTVTTSNPWEQKRLWLKKPSDENRVRNLCYAYYTARRRPATVSTHHIGRGRGLHRPPVHRGLASGDQRRPPLAVAVPHTGQQPQYSSPHYYTEPFRPATKPNTRPMLAWSGLAQTARRLRTREPQCWQSAMVAVAGNGIEFTRIR